MLNTIVIYIITTLFIFLWGYVALPKFLDLKNFHYVMLSQIIPNWLANILYLALPIAQTLVMILLMFNETRLIALSASFLMMLFFTIYIGGAAFNFYKLHLCACGKIFYKLKWKTHFLVNLFLTNIALGAALLLYIES